ncbi:MAG TPA: hypothetical protein VGC13_27275 [Longimicrobium sp.]|jgi:hypothetical protein|uniref:hypothetical protein n=1 Tax=Longimicrobium sp. TaxID=2029185 RepID=UPI002ED78737
MRRLTIPIALALILLAGCDTANPVDPPAAAPSGISTSLQNDSTPPIQSAAEGGILIGSGT